MLLGEEAIKKLSTSRVGVFGVGGVGSYVVEALSRMGVGSFLLVDSDKVSKTDINRQIIALHSTVGEYKVDVMKRRVLDINPNACVEVYKCFYTAENADEFDLSRCSYIIDAIDTVSAKLELIERATRAGLPIISSMGAGNKLDPTMFEVADIYKTSVCPLAKVMRRALKKKGVKGLKVVYSKEQPLKPIQCFEDCFKSHQIGDSDEAVSTRSRAPGSVAFVPSVAGLIIAGEVVKDIIRGDI